MDQTLRHKAFSYFTVAFALFAIVFAYVLEGFEIYPCRLCIYQRYVYYLIIGIGTIIGCMVLREITKLRKFMIFLICLLMLVGIGLSIFQVLIEHQLIEYESACTASFKHVDSPEAFLDSLNEKDLVACDKPQLVVFGISLAGWNGLYMLFMLFISLLILYKKDFPINKFLKAYEGSRTKLHH